MSTNPVAETSFALRRRHSGREALRRIMPASLRRAARRGGLWALDTIDSCLGRKRELVPPRRSNFVGDGDFEKTGDEFFSYFTRLGGLKPSHNVLEVGCGIGRMARPLTGFLTGGYEGLDIVPAGIEWCREHISTRYPNFGFTLADIYNKEYNPTGTSRGCDYRFPYPSGRFDFAFLTSVFTHMTHDDVGHYLHELARVVAPSGRCLATFFLLNAESRRMMAEGRSSLDFHYPLGGAWTTNPEIPETAIAYDYDDDKELAGLLAESGWAVESTHYGCWCGRSEYLSYQDIVVLRKLPRTSHA